MTFKNIKCDIEGPIAVVSINRPKALNALNVETGEELRAIFTDLEKDESVGGIILTGEGEKAFVAGADISQMVDMSKDDAREFAQLGQSTFSFIENLSKPVIAAVNGFALGGGTELAMACDIILASEKAKFGQPEVKLGVIPGFGGTQRLVRRVGAHLAKEIILSGGMIKADRAMAIGLVNAVYPPDQLMDEAKKLMATILTNGPVALAKAKHAINKGADLDIDAGMNVELDAFVDCFGTEDQKEGMKAFLDKRDPEFKGK